jgi:thymidine kinase
LNEQEKKSNIITYTGPMCAGKSTKLYSLLSLISKTSKNNVLLILPNKHDCCDNSVVTSRAGVCYTGVVVLLNKCNKLSSLKFDKLLKKYDYIGVDETQFLEDTSDEIYQITQKARKAGKTLFFSGLDRDFELNRFEVTEYAMDFSDLIVRYKAKCDGCGKENSAIYSKRRKNEKNQNRILIQKSAYYPLCYSCYHSGK